MSKKFVSILMGSDSDLPKVQAAIDTLKKMQIPVEVRVHSAHRTPDAVHQYIKDADTRGCAVFICCAGVAAHLAGVVASLTLKPVLGVPIDAGPLNGLDALLSTVQMPGGMPVAAMAIGRAGAKNAALFAAQILALQDPALAKGLQLARKTDAQAVLAKNVALQKTLD